MKKKIIFFYPEILDDGLQTTCQTYIKYFKKKFDISIIYFKKDKKYKFLSGIQLINIKNNIFSFINLIKKNKKNTVFFSLDKHYYLLILKILNFKFKSIIRIPNPISKNNKFTLSQNSGQVLSKFEIFFLKFSDVVIIYSKKNYNYFRNIYNLKNLEFIRNYFPKKNCQLNRKKIKNIFFYWTISSKQRPVFFFERL